MLLLMQPQLSAVFGARTTPGSSSVCACPYLQGVFNSPQKCSAGTVIVGIIPSQEQDFALVPVEFCRASVTHSSSLSL